MFPGLLWWNGILHLPLILLSVYGLIISLEEYLEGEKGYVGIYNLCRYLDLLYLTLDNRLNPKT